MFKNITFILIYIFGNILNGEILYCSEWWSCKSTFLWFIKKLLITAFFCFRDASIEDALQSRKKFVFF